MISIEIEELKKEINQIKKELIQVAEKTGLNSQDTLYCSQKLDKLIMTYQNFSYKKIK
ncbi:aspartyl-phosphate phosphatase Spo0E family protein [Metabacillus fastidiosus]|uniref:Aspartyl-phosphate phosphatase Spo0E family protein n=2 Tax=Metabacillus fastidiosus TaxID=1458 RepID=A0ABU6NUN6_9BACI|nr:aspartyl-phosphate phosphatase Spo0E family protein [Metabacillus fastidiosus]MED4400615.1 aspartyl-phosphate phosphatase Spo0E family protein [Metabacillus fastidiosus]MED4464490.1 aspartyl-phosphate phosphatase Spo0E family protein [Metabacillus fastidiosus]MED4534401.1 aspartyl-phosphate phosphatase Spo0E family protein [Metabacillus fastidiosus]